MNDIELYAQYFPVGKKIGVGIPLPDAEVFRDWAIIHEIDEDLVSLQLSRDVLPAGITLQYGQILELRGGSDESGYCCRAIVVSEGESRVLLLRLIGEIVSDELREFYRIDAFLPLKYYVCQEQNIDKLHKQWEERRNIRHQLEIDNKDKSWAGRVHPVGSILPNERLYESSAVVDNNENTSDLDIVGEDTLNQWDQIIPLAANISGGGLRFITHQDFELGEYSLLEILVPSPKRVVDVVGRVVFANRNYAAGGDREYFNTGIQFVYIDERDRDAIINYISTIQLKRIKQLREHYLYRGIMENDGEADSSRNTRLRSPVALALSVLAIAIFLAIVINYFWHYAYEHPKGEIQRTFEDGVQKYREQLKQNQ